MDAFDVYTKEPNNTYSVVEASATHLYVVTGEQLQVNDVTVELTGHTPNDAIMTTTKTYVYKVTAYNGGVPWSSGIVGFKIDNGVNELKQCNSSGYATYSKLLGIAGLHTFTVTVYSSTELLNTKVYTQIFIMGASDDETETGLSLTIGMFSQIIAPATILLFPTFLFFGITKGSVIGALIGFTVGALLGIVGNVLPVYVLIVVIIIDVMFMMYGRGE